MTSVNLPLLLFFMRLLKIGSNIMSYALAAANTQVLGALIAFFINRICETTYTNISINNDMFDLIGHSLGAHTMGFAGKRLIKPQVIRITGLDPGGSLSLQIYPLELRLRLIAHCLNLRSNIWEIRSRRKTSLHGCHTSRCHSLKYIRNSVEGGYWRLRNKGTDRRSRLLS